MCNAPMLCYLMDLMRAPRYHAPPAPPILSNLHTLDGERDDIHHTTYLFNRFTVVIAVLGTSKSTYIVPGHVCHNFLVGTAINASSEI